MAKTKSYFTCIECGYNTPRWMGSCPQCKSWNTLVEQVETQSSSKGSENHRARLLLQETESNPRKLEEIELTEDDRTTTKMPEFDRVLGGGLVKGSFILLGGDPGVGKSTLALQIARENPGMKVLYCSGEESATQIKQRAKRMQVESSGLLIFPETDLNKITSEVEKHKPDILIIDSIQTVYRPEIQSMPGTVAQIRESAGLLMRIAKQTLTTTLLIGHVTKEGDLAGPRVLEHMVDVVLQFEGDKSLNHRILRVHKNRFGQTFEIGVFEMNQTGLRDVTNPSELFLSEFSDGISGNAAACILEGNRPILLEVQALVAASSYGTPQRTSSGFDHRRLSLLLAVLEKRTGFRFSDKDVFVNVAGGLKLQDTASDLAVIMALVSALIDKPIPVKKMFIGEVGLGAEIRSVQGLQARILEAKKSGFDEVYVPGSDVKAKGIYSVKNLPELFRQVFQG